MKTFLTTRLLPGADRKGQSFVELALIIPVILILLAGIVEVASYIFTYLNLLDLTREAARFASIRDWRSGGIAPTPASNTLPLEEFACLDDQLHFYYDSACFFTDKDLNAFTRLDPANYDDVFISVVTISNGVVSDRRNWSLYNDNWRKDCEGNTVLSEPFLSNADIQAELEPNAPRDRGLVIIEVFYCYEQILQLPIISDVVPDPFRMHAYTIMPAPEAIPTPTPIP